VANYLHAMHDAYTGYLTTHRAADFATMTPAEYEAAWSTAIDVYRVNHHLPPITGQIVLPSQHIVFPIPTGSGRPQ
jgi:hypothetical protein